MYHKHVTYMTHVLGTSDEGKTFVLQRGMCRCGWAGPYRPSKDVAAHDAKDHRRTVAREPLLYALQHLLHRK
jgi:hypothetical protein